MGNRAKVGQVWRIRGWVWAGLFLSLAGASAGDISFQKYRVDPEFWSEGVAIGDVNRDGKMDVFAGDLWYETVEMGVWKRHEVRKPTGAPKNPKDPNSSPYDGTKGYSQSFANFARDINGDGWVDVILVGFPGAPFHWYENPQGKPGHWKAHMIWRSACNETPIMADLFGDGKPGIVLAYQPESKIGYFRPGPDPTKLWEPVAISDKTTKGTHQYSHGLGTGDVNKDGRDDVIINEGWWEQPATRDGSPWTFHAVNFFPPKRKPADPVRENPACADMFAYDVDGDGDNDILCSSAHMYGVWWHEQLQGTGAPKFIPHMIRDDISQSHALHLVDINGDGIKDLVTGKRFFAHQGHDPGGKEPVHLYWIEIQRQQGKPKFIPHQIDVGAGHGTQFVVADFNGDQWLDIVTSNKKGTHVFIQRRQ